MKYILAFLILLLPTIILAQNSLSGQVVDEKGKPLPFASVAILKPADSTLAYFGMTNDQGTFDIKKISNGNYLVQVAFIGHHTLYTSIKMPQQSGDYGILVLKTKSLELAQAEIVAEYIPVIMKNDTIEYNASAFKTKPDAVAEDLLKKLPGVEVDRAGNIKAMGENVQNVMVDGKEFFSSDPKVATKNLPADAIKKVQVYDKKSEASQLAGIDDSSREKTINLLLKDGKKQAWLGDVSAGVGTDKHYASSAKVYRFTTKNQFAMLGMVNNINKLGFSFRDYIDFNGGLPSMMGHGTMKLSFSSNDNVPIDFGQTINGLVTSGAGGLNYSFEPKKKSRLYASYLTNGSDRNLIQSSFTRNFIEEKEYTQNEENNEDSKSFSHRLNLGWKDKSDSTRTILANGSIGVTNSTQDAISEIKAFQFGDIVNNLESNANQNQNNLNGNGSFSIMKRGKGAVKLLSAGANVRLSTSLNKSDRLNIYRYLGVFDPKIDNQYRNNKTNLQQVDVTSSALIKIGTGLYLEPELGAKAANEYFNRSQGIKGNTESKNDLLSPIMERISYSVVPGVKLRYNSEKTKTEIGITASLAKSSNTLNDTSAYTQQFNRILPSFTWELEYKTGHRISLNYYSSVNEPQLSLLVPIVENSNPLSLFYGNRRLKPETRHELFANWLLFDQFSQTSLFARIGGTYTLDKTGYSRTINENLGQTINLINVKNDYEANSNIEFSTPLRFAGLTIHFAVDYKWNKALTYINNKENININHSPAFRLSFDNRKKDKLDLNFGGEVTLTNATYSIQKSLNNQYISYNYFTDLSYTPNDSWHFGAKADVLSYNSKSFTESVNTPLVGAEIGYNFLTNNRGMLTLEVSDILNKNKGISRISEMNYLRETRSNILGRYVLLSFKYRLNKAAKSSGGLEINVRKR